MHWQLR
jgi:hypothetical protein